MSRLNIPVTLSPDASIDLHMHTNFSDGRWPAQQLIDYLANEGFDLVSVTDHDRVDTIAGIQELAAEKNLPVLAGVEMSTDWNGKMGHMLCYGFDPEDNFLRDITESVVRLQLENTYAVHDELLRRGFSFPREEEVLAENGGKLRRPADNGRLLREHGYVADWQTSLRTASTICSSIVCASGASMCLCARRQPYATPSSTPSGAHEGLINLQSMFFL